MDHEGENCGQDHLWQELLVLFGDIHVEQVGSGHLMRLLEGVNESECDVYGQCSLELVADTRDEAIKNKWRSVASHPFTLEVG